VASRAGGGEGKGPVPALRELRDAIPKECFEPDTRESLKYAAIDLGLLAACFGVLSPCGGVATRGCSPCTRR
jgi:hypothetical protein